MQNKMTIILFNMNFLVTKMKKMLLSFNLPAGFTRNMSRQSNEQNLEFADVISIITTEITLNICIFFIFETYCTGNIQE